MAAVIKQGYHFLFYRLSELRDPRTKDWLLSGSVYPLFAVLFTYFIFVFKVGPAIMKNRPPLKLNRIIQLYNLVQVAVCSHLVYIGVLKAYNPWGYSLFCEPVDFSESEEAIGVARGVHMYFLVKVLDLLDTIFFVLRKKQNQVTFLHVYHHMGMAMFGYLGAVFLPGGHGVFLGVINSAVHAVMYTYYFITSLYPDRKHIWWKKYITQLQILQFFLVCLQFIFLIISQDCGYPKWISLFVFPQFSYFLILFLDFYRKAYKDV